MPNNSLQWLRWATDLQAIAQNGLTFCKNPFEIERYQAVRKIAAEILSQYTQLTEQAVLDIFVPKKGYMTPSLDVRGAVFNEDKILLVKESRDGLWTLPGGFVDINMSPSEAVVKEIYEESGFETRALKLFAVLDKQKHSHPAELIHMYKLFIYCEITGGEATPSIETTEIGFFAEHDIPLLSTPRTLTSQIQLCFKHHREPNLMTEFD